MWEFFNHSAVRLPLNPAQEVIGIDVKVLLSRVTWFIAMGSE